MRKDCKLILERMQEAGYEVAEPSTVDTWTNEEVDYFHANYADSYLK